jgi:hypothetical protein
MVVRLNWLLAAFAALVLGVTAGWVYLLGWIASRLVQLLLVHFL